MRVLCSRADSTTDTVMPSSVAVLGVDCACFGVDHDPFDEVEPFA